MCEFGGVKRKRGGDATGERLHYGAMDVNKGRNGISLCTTRSEQGRHKMQALEDQTQDRRRMREHKHRRLKVARKLG